MNTINAFIKENGHRLLIKNTGFNSINRSEAEAIAQALPFVYNADTHKATELIGVTNGQLERLGRLP